MSLNSLLVKLGPGLMYAGAAIGVSHLVQSTRAGAEFGYVLAGVILLSNLLKYPIFEAGPRYVAATGDSLLGGYKKLGTWAVWLFIIMTLSTMFTIQAAVTVVTAGLAETITGIALGAKTWSLILLCLCGGILMSGKYSILDKFVKIIILLLTITTIVSVISGSLTSFDKPGPFEVFTFSSKAHLLFLAALIGWMPAPIDISVWHSIWSEAKNKETGLRTNLKDALIDFNVGFIGTAFLAIGFLSLGAMAMYGSGTKFSPSAAGFARQLITLYTKSLGSWAYPVIALAAFTTMFSTTLTCLDAFPRVLREAKEQIGNVMVNKEKESKHKHYLILLIFTISGTSFFIFGFMKNMKAMVDLATTISFVVAPVLAILNILAINHKSLDEKFRQPQWLKIFSFISIIFLLIFTVGYFYIRQMV